MASNEYLRATLVEFDATVLPLTRANIEENGFAKRARVAAVDVTDPQQRMTVGIPSDSFSTVIANPPYFDGAHGTSPSPERGMARHMPGEQLDVWVRAAATHVAPGGEVIFIHVAQTLPALLASMSLRFGGIAILPLAAREGHAAIRVLVRGIKGSRAPLQLLPPRTLHDTTGRGFSPAFEAIFRGNAALDW